MFASANDYKTNAKTTLEIGSRAFANTAVDGICWAKFEKPSDVGQGQQFYRLTVDAERP